MLDDTFTPPPWIHQSESAGSEHTVTKPVSRILRGDAEHVLDLIEDNSVQLCITSPPYNIGKVYERENPKTYEEYSEWCRVITTKIVNKLKFGGSLCLQVGSYVKGDCIIPLDYIYFPIISHLGLSFRNRIVWRYNFGLHSKSRLSGRYEVILWFTKGPEYKFNLDRIRVPQLYPGKRHAARKGDKGGTPSGNPLGKNPSDYWEFDPVSAFMTDPVWNIPNVKANHPEKTMHPCQFPIELAERCVLALTDPGDLILDPFAGIGTSLVSAVAHDRHGVGIELRDEYAAIAEERISLVRRRELPVRASGQQIRVPLPNEKVARLPREWADPQGESSDGYK